CPEGSIIEVNLCLEDCGENSAKIDRNLPLVYSLKQNYPNPFNPSTQISYDIPKDGNIKITVFDVLGQEVSILVNKFQKAGMYLVTFDGSNINSGVYFYKIETTDFIETKKMVLMK